ncbi:hypothetical protein Pelo_4052 [Pelomyxa schiedti]|nr:hypothetical protein Pelo_4052 [Pelomyxa schiedti]
MADEAGRVPFLQQILGMPAEFKWLLVKSARVIVLNETSFSMDVNVPLETSILYKGMESALMFINTKQTSDIAGIDEKYGKQVCREIFLQQIQSGPGGIKKWIQNPPREQLHKLCVAFDMPGRVFDEDSEKHWLHEKLTRMGVGCIGQLTGGKALYQIAEHLGLRPRDDDSDGQLAEGITMGKIPSRLSSIHSVEPMQIPPPVSAPTPIPVSTPTPVTQSKPKSVNIPKLEQDAEYRVKYPTFMNRNIHELQRLCHTNKVSSRKDKVGCIKSLEHLITSGNLVEETTTESGSKPKKAKLQSKESESE